MGLNQDTWKRVPIQTLGNRLLANRQVRHRNQRVQMHSLPQNRKRRIVSQATEEWQDSECVVAGKRKTAAKTLLTQNASHFFGFADCLELFEVQVCLRRDDSPDGSVSYWRIH